MKKNLFLYLFIFSLLINVFTYMYFSGKEKFQSERADKLQSEVKGIRDTLALATSQLDKANYFAFENNENALDYFAGKDVEQIAIKVRDAIYAQNAKPGGNSLVGYPQMGEPFTINNYKILNHRWVIVDFSNGTIKGETILKYFVDDNGEISFETAETLLYTNTVNN